MSKHSNPLQAIFNVQPGERLITFLLFLWQFLFICTYYVLRPVRRGLFLDGLGNEYMPLVYVGTALITGVVVWLYSKFSHLPRKKLISGVYGIFIVNLLLWWQAFQRESAVTSGVFWVWLDVFSIMGVTLFWMYANDVFDSTRAKRLFGILAAGGGLGAVMGSSITAALVKQIGAANLLPVAAGLVAATLAIFYWLEATTKNITVIKRSAAKEFDNCNTSKFSGVISTVFKNRFLLLLTLLVTFERVTPDMVQFLYNGILKNMATGGDAIAALDANLERWRAIAEFLIELFLVSAVLRKFGTKFSLMSNGGLIFAGLVSFALVPNPLVIIAVFHLDEASRHAWFKAAKELMYTVTSRDVLYTVKPVIEMFFYRFARGIAGVCIFVFNTLFGLGSTGVLIAGSVIAAAWCAVAWQLAKEYRRLEIETYRRLEGFDGMETKEQEKQALAV